MISAWRCGENDLKRRPVSLAVAHIASACPVFEIGGHLQQLMPTFVFQNQFADIDDDDCSSRYAMPAMSDGLARSAALPPSSPMRRSRVYLQTNRIFHYWQLAVSVGDTIKHLSSDVLITVSMPSRLFVSLYASPRFIGHHWAKISAIGE